MSKDTLAMGDTNTTDTSNQDQNPMSQGAGEQEQLSLVEKTRLGLSSFQEDKESGEEVSPLHASTPIKTSLTPEQAAQSAGLLLRYHRERLGYSIQELSAYLKVRTTTVADLENDQLAQETAVNFTTSLLRRYAKLVNIDADQVVDLYMQKVNSLVKIKQENAEKPQDNHMLRSVAIVVLVVVVAGVGSLFAFLGDGKSSSEPKNQEVTGVLSNGTDELQAGMELPMDKVTGSLAINDQGEANEVTGTEQESAPVQPLSANTLKAQAQAEALSASRKSSEVEANDKQPDSLPLNEETVERQKAEAAQKAQEQQAQQAALAQAQQEAANQKAQTENAKTEASAQSDKATADKSTADKSSEDKNADDKATPPALAKSLKDISKQVKVANIDTNELPSLNKVEITVLKDVALEVKGNGKSLKTGLFKAGEKLNINGIPPFAVSVSDTEAVRINYRNGEVQTPKSTQVSFELPLK